MELSTEQLRALTNAGQLYDALKAVQVPLSRLSGGMYWRVINSKEYLYKYYRGQVGTPQTKSLGPRSIATEAIHEEFTASKGALTAQRDGIKARIEGYAPVWRALHLPSIDSVAANVLRAFDQMNFGGRNVLTIGTYALKAYEVEANAIFSTGMDATDDLDFTLFIGASTTSPDGAAAATTLEDLAHIPRQMLLTLKQVDSSFIVSPHTQKTVINDKGYLIDLLCSEADAKQMSGSLPWRPEGLKGQDWLHRGRHVRHVIVDFRGWPVPIDVPDPRYFALHKLWLSKQPNRSATKRPKDQRQGTALLRVVRDHMPHFPFDEMFLKTLPQELRSEFEEQFSRLPPPTSAAS